jgi:hypothetical protein
MAKQITQVKVDNRTTARLIAHAAGARALEGFIEHVLDRLDAAEDELQKLKK